MKGDFPVIHEPALSSDGKGTLGGTMTIRPPGYLLEVTNPQDDGSNPPVTVISATGTQPPVVESSVTVVFVGGTQLIPGPPGPTGPAGSTRMPTPINLSIVNSTVAVDAGTPPGTVLFAPIYLRLVLTENVAILNPVNGADSQRLIIELIQDSVGGRTVTWGSDYKFGTDVPLSMTTAGANKRDFFAWVLTNGKWDCVGITRGY